MSEKETQTAEVALSEQINTATRSLHTQINRIIVQRLPLALPPHSNNPKLYALGLSRIAPIYFTFELIWKRLITPHPISPSQTINHRVFSALKQLYIPQLLRTSYLEADLQFLHQQTASSLPQDLATLEDSHIKTMVSHVGQVCTDAPHVLIACAYVMYMALFNGGRWIQSELPKAQSGGGLDFWYFPGPDNGQGVKNEFKARLMDVPGVLAAEQRLGVVREAQNIFGNLMMLIEELDGLTAESLEGVTEDLCVTGGSGSEDSVRKYLLPQAMVELLSALVGWIGRRRLYTWLFFWIYHEADVKGKIT